MESLEWNGERYLPHLKGAIELEHIHRYLIARQLVQGKDVLDIASGEGYGSKMLAEEANSVIGVDISAAAIVHAKQKYYQHNLKFEVGCCSDIPLPNASVDIVVSFETIEHHDKHDEMMDEINRVLRPNGFLIISSPDKYQYSDVPKYVNDFHVKELYHYEFKDLLRKYFKNFKIFGQRIIYGSAIASDASAPGLMHFHSANQSLITKSVELSDPLYFIAIASQSILPSISGSIFEQPIEDSNIVMEFKNILSEKNAAIREYELYIAQSNENLENNLHITSEKDSRILTLSSNCKKYNEEINRLIRIITNKNNYFIKLAKIKNSYRNLKVEFLEKEKNIACLNSEMSLFKSSINCLQNENYNLKNELSEFQNELNAVKAQLIEGDNKYTLLQKEMSKVLSSFSWKITKPYRILGSKFKSILNLKKEIHGIQNNYGGYITLLKKTYSVYMKFGFSGIKERIHNIKKNQLIFPYYSNKPNLEKNKKVNEIVENESYYVKESSKKFNQNLPVQIIAFYLPQYHVIAENSQWWGENFTDWHNVRPAIPLYEDHYQPHIPDSLGYYDLSNIETQKKQIQLAQSYGISGFCFYFYWFKGQRLLEQPILNYLENKELDHPFCLCWANENWSRRWDGLDNEILISQEYSADDDIAFISYISKYFKDTRYIKIENKPFLVIYRPNLFPNINETIKRWRDWCLNNGIGKIYIAYVQSFENTNPEKYGFDAAIEFPPNNTTPPNVTEKIKPFTSSFAGTVYDWSVYLSRSAKYDTPHYKIFRTVCPSWDNTARKKNRSVSFINSSPRGFQEWLFNASIDTVKRFDNQSERIVFVNAWNEWAEGAHLEPDAKYGYAWLEASKLALQRTYLSIEKKANPSIAEPIAIIIHVFYLDLFPEILKYLNKIRMTKFKLFISTIESNFAQIKYLLDENKFDYHLACVPNKGRDILPFLNMMEIVKKENFSIFIKIHTKKSSHRADGDEWRNDLFKQLLRDKTIKKAIKRFSKNQDLGIIGPDGHVIPIRYFMGSNSKQLTCLSNRLGVKTENFMNLNFVAGSMFIARVNAIVPLLTLNLGDADFEEEEGQIDGTYAHAVERAIAVSASSVNLTVESLKIKKMELNYKYAAANKV